ncbi:MAG: PAS domain-containing protein [Alphaproteobacteria bacterium]|nr:PAS domain-containing protein [Alphaproteobacteria bacterium]
MNGFVLAAVTLASALAGGALAWPIARLGRRQMVRELQMSAAALADERARRIAAEAALRQNESMAMTATPVASWEWDIGSGEVTWSPAMYSLFGLDAVGAPPSRARLMAMIHAQDRGHAAAWLATLARAEAPPPIEVRALRADGAVRLLRCECLGIGDDTGRARRLLITVRDVTDHAPVAFGNARPRDAQVALAALIGAAVCLVEPEAEAAGVTFVPAVPPDIGVYAGSDRALTEIVVRLLGNAVARSQRGGRVTLRAARLAAGVIELEIADMGAGLTADEIGERSVLGQAKTLAEGEGGTLYVTSLPGAGLAVTVRLPATGAAQKVA